MSTIVDIETDPTVKRIEELARAHGETELCFIPLKDAEPHFAAWSRDDAGIAA